MNSPPPSTGAETPTLLFQSHNRRGLGHLMRGLNLAREMLLIRPEARVVMHTRNSAAGQFCPRGVECVVDGGSEAADAFGDVPPSRSRWRQVLQDRRPQLVVYDTLVPEDPSGEPIPAGTRVGFVMRKSRPERHAQLLNSGFLERCDAIVVPHGSEEFEYELPASLTKRTIFSGAIARRPDPRNAPALRRKYGVGDGDLLLVSTAGGGGFEHSAVPFFGAIRGVCARLSGQSPRRIRHVVILGPQFGGEAPEFPGASVVESEPDLVDLFALADLVVSEGGYNSVSELRAIGTPAVFVPGRRTYDDQHARVDAMASRGVAVVADQAGPGGVADAVLSLLLDPSRLLNMREIAAANPVSSGNRVAAAHLLGPLAESR